MSAFYGLRWAVQISMATARQREIGLYDLTALTPAGALGASWAICVAGLHKGRAFKEIETPGSWVMRVGFLLLVLLAAQTPVPVGDGLLVALVAIFQMIALCAVLYLDHIGALTLACLIGMLAPTYTRARMDAGAAAFLGFLLIQVSTYVFIALLAWVMLPWLCVVAGWPDWACAIGIPVVCLVVYAGVRAVIQAALWRMLLTRLNASDADLAEIINEART
jgi:hypothetical protein